MKKYSPISTARCLTQMSQQAELKPICAGFRTEGMKKKKLYGTEGDDH